MKLFGYWRSSATYRVRIALNLKGIEYDYEPVNLLEGVHKSEPYGDVNPQALVPSLVTDDGATLTQSLAIIAYLEETHPEPSLLPDNPVARAHARALALSIGCEAQPLMNLRTQKYLRKDLKASDEQVVAWLENWIGGTLTALEKQVSKDNSRGDFCFGGQPGLAEAFLVPQLFASARFGVDIEPYPTLRAIADKCNTLKAFQDAHPKNQQDAPKD